MPPTKPAAVVPDSFGDPGNDPVNLPTVWERLRAPFNDSEVGKLPRYVGPRDTPKHERPKGHCDVCGKYHETQSIHLDYVGHAEVTDRLLAVDPSWNWEPLAWDDVGLPMVTHRGKTAELWIKLTVGEVTRLGIGTAPIEKDDLVKQLISDAIRNGAMRFGVALDLWKRGTEDDADDRSPVGPPSGPVERPCPSCGHNVTDNRAAHAKDSKNPAWRCSNRACTGGSNDRPWASWHTDKVPAQWGAGTDDGSGSGSPTPPTPSPARNPVWAAQATVLAAMNEANPHASDPKRAASLIWRAALSQFGYEADDADIPAEQVEAVLVAALDMVHPAIDAEPPVTPEGTDGAV